MYVYKFIEFFFQYLRVELVDIKTIFFLLPDFLPWFPLDELLPLLTLIPSPLALMLPDGREDDNMVAVLGELFTKPLNNSAVFK